MDILASGPIPPNPAEILGSSNCFDIINSLKNISKLVNGVYAHFELLEYIVPPKKKYTKSEIKQCKIKAEIRDNNAMKELETEIKMRNK